MKQNRALRIFIFDDDPSITRLLSLVLTDKGHDVHTFKDPTYCHLYPNNQCECLQDFPCAEVVISDVFLPARSRVG